MDITTTTIKADTKEWLGLHAKDGRKKPGANGSRPNVKTAKAQASRTKSFNDSMSKLSSSKGYYAPGSQNPHKIRGK